MNKIRVRNLMITPTNAENAPDNSQHQFTIKTPNQVAIEGMYLSIMEAASDRPRANIISVGKTRKFFL